MKPKSRTRIAKGYGDPDPFHEMICGHKTPL
jgi:hypothetical protein